MKTRCRVYLIVGWDASQSVVYLRDWRSGFGFSYRPANGGALCLSYRHNSDKLNREIKKQIHGF